MRTLFFILILANIHSKCFSLASVSYAKLLKENSIGSKIKISRSFDSLHSSHMGKCVAMSIISYKGNPVNVLIEKGTVLRNSDTNHQDLVTLEPTYVMLIPNQQVEIPLYAVCCRLHRSCPTEQDEFFYDQKASGYLACAIDTLNLYKEYGNLAQEIVWTFTDNIPLSNAFNSIQDKEKENFIIAQIAEMQGIPVPKRDKTQMEQLPVTFRWQHKGEWEFEVDKPTTFSVYIVDGNNRVVATLWDVDTENNLGTMKITYNYNGKLPAGKYAIIQRKDNRLITAKEVTLPE